MLAVVECGCVFLVKVNEYPALPRTANAVAVTAFHAVRDARLGDMSGAADKRTVVAVHGKFMQSLFHRLPSPHNVVLHPRHNRTRHAWLSGMAWIFLRHGLGFRVIVVGQFTKEMSWTAIWEQRHACAARARASHVSHEQWAHPPPWASSPGRMRALRTSAGCPCGDTGTRDNLPAPSTVLSLVPI